MLVTPKEMYRNSITEKYAVGAFDATNHFLAECIIHAAEIEKQPVILMVPVFAFGSFNDAEFVRYLVRRCESAEVPIALHLDHATTYEQCMYAISKGFTSVMIDGSSLPLKDNIALTKSVVKSSHACSVMVEAEVGHVAGNEASSDGSVADESLYTQTPDALRFIDETQVDALAVAFGTVHGLYKGKPNLNFARLDDLRKNIGIPLVMHGGSGLSEDDFRNVVRHGINKINIFSEISLSSSKMLFQVLQKSQGNMHIQDAFLNIQDNVVSIIKNQIKLFNDR